MFRGVKVIRIVPDAPGKGGVKTSLHTFQGIPINDTLGGFNFHQWLGSWRKDFAASAITDPTLVTNGTFTGSLAPWTGGPNWTYSGGTALHAAGSATPIEQTVANAVTNTRYDFSFTISGRTAGAIIAVGLTSDASMVVAGDFYVTSGSLSANNTVTGTVVCRSAPDTSTSAKLFIVPDSNFDGAIDDVVLSLLKNPSNYTGPRVYGFHVFNRYDTSNLRLPASSYLLSHYDGTASGSNTNYIWCHSEPLDETGNRYVMKRSFRGIRTRFLTVKNRCFISTSDSQAWIFQGAVTNPNALEQIQSPTYNLGIGQPSKAPTVSIIADTGVAMYNSYFGLGGNTYITNPNPNSLLQNLTTGVTLTLPVYNATTGAPEADLSIATHGATLPVSGITYASTAGYASGPFPVPNQIYLLWDDWQQGSCKVTIRGTNWVAGGVKAIGAALNWGEPSYGAFNPTNTHGGIIVQYTDVGADTEILLDVQQYFKPGRNDAGVPDKWELRISGTIVTLAAAFTANRVSWAPYPPSEAVADLIGAHPLELSVTDAVDLGAGIHTWSANTVGYAYAWYDPVTGHISNISPIGFNGTDQGTPVRVGINITNTASGIEYPPIEDRTRFTHILFFRALYSSGGGTLFVVGSLDPSAGNWYGISSDPTKNKTYWFDLFPDSDLIVAGALRAPQFTNSKPVVTRNGKVYPLFPKDMAYWDGRLWLSSVQEPGSVRYSCDQVQCTFGVPEESFPATNVLRIPADDGEVTAIKMIQDKLLVVTDRWAYIVAGNNETNYRLLRVSTWMPGVGVHQIAEFPAEAEESSGAIAFLGRDRRVYMMALGSSPMAISEPVQDLIDNAVTSNQGYEDIRLHATVSNGKRLLFMTTALGNLSPNLIILEYDLDQRIWMRSNYLTAARAFQTRFVTEIVDRELAIDATDGTPGSITIKSWWNPSATTAALTGAVDTFPTNFDGQKTRKQIQWVKAYIAEKDSGTPSTWTLETWLDGISKGVVNFEDFNLGTIQYPEMSQTPTGYNWDIVAVSAPGTWSVRELIVKPLAFTTDNSMAWCYRANFRVNFPANTNLARVYALDVGYVTLTEDGAVDP